MNFRNLFFTLCLLTSGYIGIQSSAVYASDKIKSFEPVEAKKYITGRRGGCYYINKNGNKTYVDRSLCRQR